MHDEEEIILVILDLGITADGQGVLDGQRMDLDSSAVGAKRLTQMRRPLSARTSRSASLSRLLATSFPSLKTKD
jgi:hypothetical protein